MKIAINYEAKVKKVDGKTKLVSGNIYFDKDEEVTQYILKCRILFDNFKNGEAIGTDNVKLIDWGILQ